ncbi:hypothetical protein H0H93_014984 [Arthromyces matolae]|nr:hypothetical protein H0H93_014984 [Arthromyces matolae]
MWTALFATLATAGFASASFASTEPLESRYYAPRASKIAPKVFIISLTQFDLEGSVWYNIPEFNVLAQNITVPGFSPLYPDAHCTRDGSICQLTAGEGEINAALSLSALIRSPSFNLRDTYFLIGGIAGVNPKVATLGSVTFARFAVQVTLQYEFDAREIPSNFATGYVPQGATAPGQYPTEIYGTEVFEVNMHKTGVRYAIPQLRRPTGQGFRLGFRPNLRFSGASWDSKWPRKGWRNGDELSISDITPKDIASVGVSYNADLSFGGKISNLASQKMQDFPVFRHGIEDLVQRLTMKYRYVNASSSVNISLNVYEVLKTVAEIATAFVSDETSTVTVVPEMYYGGPRAHVYKHPYSGAKLCLPASYADFALVEHDKTLNSLYLDGEEGYSVVSTQKPRHILLVTTCEESSLSLRPDGPTIAHCLLLMVSHGLSEARLCRSDGKKWNFVLLRKSPKTEKLTAYWSENLASYLFKSTEGVVDISVPALSQLAVVLLEWFKPIETDLFTTVR